MEEEKKEKNERMFTKNFLYKKGQKLNRLRKYLKRAPQNKHQTEVAH